MAYGANRFASCQAALEGRNEMAGLYRDLCVCVCVCVCLVLCLLLEKLTIVQPANESPPLGNWKLHYCVRVLCQMNPVHILSGL
jgi:hypothetical protein